MIKAKLAISLSAFLCMCTPHGPECYFLYSRLLSKDFHLLKMAMFNSKVLRYQLYCCCQYPVDTVFCSYLGGFRNRSLSSGNPTQFQFAQFRPNPTLQHRMVLKRNSCEIRHYRLLSMFRYFWGICSFCSI